MTKKERLKKIKDRYYYWQCTKGHKKDTIGCASCFVSSTMTMINPKTLKWLIDQVEATL